MKSSAMSGERRRLKYARNNGRNPPSNRERLPITALCPADAFGQQLRIRIPVLRYDIQPPPRHWNRAGTDRGRHAGAGVGIGAVGTPAQFLQVAVGISRYISFKPRNFLGPSGSLPTQLVLPPV